MTQKHKKKKIHYTLMQLLFFLVSLTVVFCKYINMNIYYKNRMLHKHTVFYFAFFT